MKDSSTIRVTKLIRGLRANQSAFIETANKTHDTQLANLCYRMASDRGRFAKAIASLQPELDVEEDTRLCHLVMQLARRLTAALRHGDSYAVIGSLIRSEDDLIEQYRVVLAELDIDAIEQEIEAQYRMVRGTRVQLTAFREDYRASGLFHRKETTV